MSDDAPTGHWLHDPVTGAPYEFVPAKREDRRSPVEPGQNRPVLAVIRRTLSRGGYTVHATSLQYLVDLVDDLTARAEKAEAERDALRTALDDLEEVGRGGRP